MTERIVHDLSEISLGAAVRLHDTSKYVVTNAPYGKEFPNWVGHQDPVGRKNIPDADEGVVVGTNKVKITPFMILKQVAVEVDATVYIFDHKAIELLPR